MLSNLALFCLATVLATFRKIGQLFSKSSGHPACFIKNSSFWMTYLQMTLCQKDWWNDQSMKWKVDELNGSQNDDFATWYFYEMTN